jgi:hypothetical protein
MRCWSASAESFRSSLNSTAAVRHSRCMLDVLIIWRVFDSGQGTAYATSSLAPHTGYFAGTFIDACKRTRRRSASRTSPARLVCPRSAGKSVRKFRQPLQSHRITEWSDLPKEHCRLVASCAAVAPRIPDSRHGLYLAWGHWRSWQRQQVSRYRRLHNREYFREQGFVRMWS